MVITVQKPMSLDEAFANLDEVLAEAVHEYEYGLLSEQYTYLQENGVIMEEAVAAEAKKNWFLRAIEKIAEAFENLWNAAVAKIEKWKNDINARIENAKAKREASKAADEKKGLLNKIRNDMRAKINLIKKADPDNAKEKIAELKEDAKEKKEEVNEIASDEALNALAEKWNSRNL